MLRPFFKHNCARCKFLGHLDGRDAYICQSSVILRASDEESDYTSCLTEMAEAGAARMPCPYSLAIVYRMSKETE